MLRLYKMKTTTTRLDELRPTLDEQELAIGPYLDSFHQLLSFSLVFALLFDLVQLLDELDLRFDVVGHLVRLVRLDMR